MIYDWIWNAFKFDFFSSNWICLHLSNINYQYVHGDSWMAPRSMARNNINFDFFFLKCYAIAYSLVIFRMKKHSFCFQKCNELTVFSIAHSFSYRKHMPSSRHFKWFPVKRKAKKKKKKKINCSKCMKTITIRKIPVFVVYTQCMNSFMPNNNNTYTHSHSKI